MHQIDNSTAATTMPAIGAVGPKPNGYFSAGDPVTSIPPTRVEADWWNALMMELINVLVGAGITPVKAERDQLYKAIYKLIFGDLPVDSRTLVSSPLASDLELLGVIGVNGTFSPLAGSDINFTCAQLRVSGLFQLADQASISAISDATFTTGSDTIVPTQHAAKAFVDGFDLSGLAWHVTSEVISAYIPGTIAVGSGNVDVGFIEGLPILQPTAGTLRNVIINWEDSAGNVSNDYPPWGRAGVTATFTILKNGTPSAMTTTITNATPLVILSGTVALAAGDTFALRINVSGASAHAIYRLAWTGEIEA